MAEVILWFSEDENEIVPELVELRVEQPILINPTLTGDQPSAQLPPLQWFEFDVATIAFETSTPSISLQPFLFTLATLTRPFPTEMSVEDKLAAINEEFWNHIGMHLNYVQELILRGTLENKTYQQIATEPHFTSNYLRTEASELWQLLSPILGEKVTKKSFEDTLNRWLWQRCTQRQQREGQQFIEYLDNDFTLEMVQIPAGNVLMGSPENEPERSPSESPQHIVEVTSFFLSKYPVTQAQWRSVAAMPQVNRELDPDPSRFKGDDRPVETINWYAAVEFCDRLSQHTGKQYRLPSEAEWEYACRAGTTTPFHFGETITTDLANYHDNLTYGDGLKGIYRHETTPVGSFGVANAFGLYDMHGNVWDWCADHWHESYKGVPVDGSAWVKGGDSEFRLLRGGSWDGYSRLCSSAYRARVHAFSRLNYVGFRVACSA
ncbi:formylglycine-generating enzyme family protein [Trichocoleus sp. FACHB-46]|nr:formylglycine-generating enzyme family protein [Trichocoleus sp. FACHB-46]